MKWKDFRNKCKQLNLNVGKAWVNLNNRDYTKHHKVVECWNEGYSRAVVAVNVPYADMYKIIKLELQISRILQQC